MCKCSALAQSIYTTRHDRMLRLEYHAILQKFELSDDSYRATPWHKESPPKSSVENENAKALWNIPIHQDIPPKNGANKPDIVACFVVTHSSGDLIRINFTIAYIQYSLSNKPTCRLINPTKSETGKISKNILDRINSTIAK